MKKSTLKSVKESSKVIIDLLALHQKFHGFLDRLAAGTDDVAIINLLIEIRRVNVDCISKYTGLLSRQKYSSPMVAKTLSNGLANFRKDDMTLWNIHAQLARFVPEYNKALRNKHLSQVSRMIISQNNDQLILMKEQLLHPLPSLQLA